MEPVNPERPPAAAGGHRKRLSYPTHKVIGFVDGPAAEVAVAALVTAGFAADQIEVVTGEDARDLERPADRPGIAGLLNRIALSMGADLEHIERAGRELAAGHVLIAVPVDGDDAKERVRGLLLRHGGHSISYFGSWTIESLA